MLVGDSFYEGRYKVVAAWWASSKDVKVFRAFFQSLDSEPVFRAWIQMPFIPINLRDVCKTKNPQEKGKFWMAWNVELGKTVFLHFNLSSDRNIWGKSIMGGGLRWKHKNCICLKADWPTTTPTLKTHSGGEKSNKCKQSWNKSRQPLRGSEVEIKPHLAYDAASAYFVAQIILARLINFQNMRFKAKNF